ncbi:hypothetical protein RO3G_07045 [Rhizopus delemar RA 99-880]|uniref:Uncharacterized protein n=1 Tax=Rhizopus delemar (strain RA 99-880 / ATCC MYA-4621 / FGSC 9543 / NRRL 43880) TaxID=246409 RepID=I1C1L0_RHIO9|nr:hypothetical protein RO3G_07045 [Rhizopus delemar RA 99-880]|eukprot:EIE82340.1 hypothetical protein RO3G_07045 [Rhizopus delemar RA 99-880]
MFIGDRGTRVGSRIKGFKKYGGRWKEVIHSEATNVCVTNENLTSKTCIFCFRRLTHPRISVTKNGEVFSRKVKGSFYCTNPLGVSVLSKCAAKSRDSLSALAIGIVGLSTILFGAPLPAFKSHKISKIEAEEYIILTSPSRFEEETGSYAVVLEIFGVGFAIGASMEVFLIKSNYYQMLAASEAKQKLKQLEQEQEDNERLERLKTQSAQ